MIATMQTKINMLGTPQPIQTKGYVRKVLPLCKASSCTAARLEGTNPMKSG